MSQTPPTHSSHAGETPFRYSAALANQIEVAWQQRWDELGTFVQPNPGQPGFDASKPKFYCLDMFPYPSGAGLHVGHPEGYTATDIVCRCKRMRGFNVLHPMGWDAFGLPAEQYAIQTGIHPAITTRKSIDTFRRQLKRFGFGYDWTREFGTIDPEFYRWTQWIFLKLYDSWFDPAVRKARPITELVAEFESGRRAAEPNPQASGNPPHTPSAWSALSPDDRRTIVDSYRLAYLGTTTVNWCPKLGTVLANDEVIDGRSERGGYPVLRKPLRQWMFRITAYADRLIDGLKTVDWPASTRTMQEEWIGRSEGAEIHFPVDSPRGGSATTLCPTSLTVFTTRPDTLFGATFMVVAPEHPLVDAVIASPAPETCVAALDAYVRRARNTSDIERMESKQKTGVFTGLFATNPATGVRIPVWTADYVLMGYGTGAIMAVPAHDERDYAFAKQFGLPIRDVVYDRTRLAMAYFARHAPSAVRTPERWQGVLADFLGWVTSHNAGPERFAEGLHEVAVANPWGESTAVPIHTDAPPEDAAGSVGQRRGATRIIWLDAITEMGFTGLDDFTDRFLRARFFDALGSAWPAPGIAANSANASVSINGLGTEDAKSAIIAWLESAGLGRRRVNYKFRDWTFSRQRYWGEPFPIVYDEQGRHYAVSERALPVVLPELADYAPIESDDPKPLLAKAESWVNTTAGAAGVDPALLPPDTPVRRETNTMPGSAGSSWYMLRYCDARNDREFCSRDADAYWMGGRAPGATSPADATGRAGGVDLYLGGSEHAVGHLLYSRFWHMVLFDLGYLSTPEPFHKLFHQGLITSFSYQRPDKTLVPSDQVDEPVEGQFVERGTGVKLTPVVAKMSKSLKNVVNPDDVIAQYGADTFRLYEMYMGPLEASKPWNPRDITGLFRFLQRAWRVAIDEKTGALLVAQTPDPTLEKLLHRMIAKVGDDIDKLAFNTAIAAMIGFVNECGPGSLTADQIGRFVRALSPFAPHAAEEIWSRLPQAVRHATGLGDAVCSVQPWPGHDPAMLRDEAVELAVQVMGKIRCKITVPADAEIKAIEDITLAHEDVKRALSGRSVKKIIVVPGRLVNIVAG